MTLGAATCLVWWNEHRTVRKRRAFQETRSIELLISSFVLQYKIIKRNFISKLKVCSTIFLIRRQVTSVESEKVDPENEGKLIHVASGMLAYCIYPLLLLYNIYTSQTHTFKKQLHVQKLTKKN